MSKKQSATESTSKVAAVKARLAFIWREHLLHRGIMSCLLILIRKAHSARGS